MMPGALNRMLTSGNPVAMSHPSEVPVQKKMGEEGVKPPRKSSQERTEEDYQNTSSCPGTPYLEAQL